MSKYVLVLAQIELIFFLIASVGLCFGFVLKTVWVTHQCFHYCWAVLTQSQGFFCFSHHPTSEEARGARGVGRGHSQDSWPQMTTGIFRTTWRHAQCIRWGEEEGSRGHSEWWHLSSRDTVRCDGALLSWRWLNTCLPMGSSEWVPCFALLADTAFAYLINCLYLNPRVFSLLPFHFSPPCHSEWEASEQMCEADLPTGVKPRQTPTQGLSDVRRWIGSSDLIKVGDFLYHLCAQFVRTDTCLYEG